MIPKNKIFLLAVVMAIAVLLVTPTTSLFTGFDDNPAARAAETDARFDGNPAVGATKAVPQYMREDTRIRQRTTVSANASANATGDAHVRQDTSTRVDDTVHYRSDRKFDNVFITQEARSQIRQDCRNKNGSCTQNATSDIRQRTDARPGRFSNVFVTQDAQSDINQNCRARECNQYDETTIQQEVDVAGDRWSSNGFVNRY